MLKRWFILAGLMAGTLGAAVPATQPAEPGSLEFRAVTALNRGEYSAALPLLEKLLEQNTDESKKGMIEEQIRVAKAQIASAATQPAGAPGEVQIPISAETRKKHTPPAAGEVRELGIQELGNF